MCLVKCLSGHFFCFFGLWLIKLVSIWFVNFDYSMFDCNVIVYGLKWHCWNFSVVVELLEMTQCACENVYWICVLLNVVQICLGGIRLRDRLSRLRTGVTDLGQGGWPLLVVHGGRQKHYTLLWLIEGEVGERDLLEMMLQGGQRRRRVHPRLWTRRSISSIMRSISSHMMRISFRSLSPTSTSLLFRSLLLRSRLLLRSLSRMMSLSSMSSLSSLSSPSLVFRGCRGWCMRPTRTAMQGGLLTSGFYLTLVDMWHAGYGSMPM